MEGILSKIAKFKSFIIILIVALLMLTQQAFAGDIFKITSVNFDTSNSLIFLTSPDNTTEGIMKNVKLLKLQNPKRVFFDINSAILTTPAHLWTLNSNGIKQVKINQYSKNPNKVRVVLTLDENFDLNKIHFYKVNNNIAINYKGGMCKSEYYQTIYRDERASSKDFYENLSITNDQIQETTNSQLSQVQNAFADTTGHVTSVSKNLKLKSKYYLNYVSANANGFLLNGFGTVAFERPMYLANPARVMFDIPNSIANPSTLNKEIKIGTDTLRVSQVISNKVRVTITSADLEKYFPVYSSDGQSAIFLKSETTDITSLFARTNDAISYQSKNLSPNSGEFTISFNSPVVMSVKRGTSLLTIDLFNTLRFNEQYFKEAIAGTNMEDLNIDLLPKVGLKMTLPLAKTSTINVRLGADGKSIKIIAKGLVVQHRTSKNKSNYKPLVSIVLPSSNQNSAKRHSESKNVVVLDAGHGGKDYGAIRCGVNEKDINLDVIKRIQSILLSNNISVVMTRTTDDFISLHDRAAITAQTNPDVFVSVHVNACSSPNSTGIETHYYHENSIELANMVHSPLVSYVKSKDRGIMKSKFYVINHSSIPSILVEIGFISNTAERNALLSERRKQQTAQAIAKGIMNYLNSN